MPPFNNKQPLGIWTPGDHAPIQGTRSMTEAIGRVTGGTINDVLLTVASGALGRYLRANGEPVGGLNIAQSLGGEAPRNARREVCQRTGAPARSQS